MNDELRGYQDAVWAYLLEHCDIEPNGTLFVKFHTKGRSTFENHIVGRWRYGYHRGNPKLRETEHLDKRLADWERRLEKKERWLRNMARGTRVAFWRKALFYLGLDKMI
jgi:hypothetical protein